VLNACAGTLVCDSRGVGRDWRAAELLMVAEMLLGTADGLTDPAELTEDFRAMTEKVMGKVMTDVTLRLRTPVGVTVRYLKEMYPRILDLTAHRVEVSPRRCRRRRGGRHRPFHVDHSGKDRLSVVFTVICERNKCNKSRLSPGSRVVATVVVVR
jgi:hypothetical protein